MKECKGGLSLSSEDFKIHFESIKNYDSKFDFCIKSLTKNNSKLNDYTFEKIVKSPWSEVNNSMIFLEEE